VGPVSAGAAGGLRRRDRHQPGTWRRDLDCGCAGPASAGDQRLAGARNAALAAVALAGWCPCARACSSGWTRSPSRADGDARRMLRVARSPACARAGPGRLRGAREPGAPRLDRRAVGGVVLLACVVAASRARSACSTSGGARRPLMVGRAGGGRARAGGAGRGSRRRQRDVGGPGATGAARSSSSSRPRVRLQDAPPGAALDRTSRGDCCRSCWPATARGTSTRCSCARAPGAFPYVLSPALGITYQVGKLPTPCCSTPRARCARAGWSTRASTWRACSRPRSAAWRRSRTPPRRGGTREACSDDRRTTLARPPGGTGAAARAATSRRSFLSRLGTRWWVRPRCRSSRRARAGDERPAAPTMRRCTATSAIRRAATTGALRHRRLPLLVLRRLAERLPAGHGDVALTGSAPAPSGDGKDYIISYNDCCGSRCACAAGARAPRRAAALLTMKNNDLLWCFGTQSRAVNCSSPSSSVWRPGPRRRAALLGLLLAPVLAAAQGTSGPPWTMPSLPGLPSRRWDRHAGTVPALRGRWEVPARAGRSRVPGARAGRRAGAARRRGPGAVINWMLARFAGTTCRGSHPTRRKRWAPPPAPAHRRGTRAAGADRGDRTSEVGSYCPAMAASRRRAAATLGTRTWARLPPVPTWTVIASGAARRRDPRRWDRCPWRRSRCRRHLGEQRRDDRPLFTP